MSFAQSKPTFVEIADVANAAYNSDGDCTVTFQPTVQPSVLWKRSDTRTNLFGFYAAIFRRNDGCRVLAFRGTDDLWDALLDDSAIGIGGLPPQAVDAIKLAQAVGLTKGDMITGHSLGGALALIAAAHSGHAAVSFNAPGVMDSCMVSAVTAKQSGGWREFLQIVRRCAVNSRAKNIRIAGDPVSGFLTGLQVGSPPEKLAAPSCGWLDVICRHGMSTVVAAMRSNADYHRQIDL